MHDRWHRLALPLCLSVFLHGVFFLVVCVPTVVRQPPAHTTVEAGTHTHPLSLSIGSAPRRRVRPPMPAEEYLPVEVEPRVVAPGAMIREPAPGGSPAGNPGGDAAPGGMVSAGVERGAGRCGRRSSGVAGRAAEGAVGRLPDRSLAQHGAVRGGEQAAGAARRPRDVAARRGGAGAGVQPHHPPLVPSPTGLTLRGLVSLADLFARWTP
ncbi:MAG: hypothetical protein U0736_01125 [Gemmataceae bacterium]